MTAIILRLLGAACCMRATTTRAESARHRQCLDAAWMCFTAADQADGCEDGV